MKLYFSPGACSLSPHIVLLETGLGFETEQVDLRSKRTASGADYTSINPKGYVPALQLNSGMVLTEGPAIVQYLADQAPERHLAPMSGSLARYQLAEWLNFISTEVHKGFGPLFNPQAGDDVQEAARAHLARRFDYLAATLSRQDYLLGDQYSVADAYLYTVLTWTAKLGIDLGPWPALPAFQARVGERPAVRRALRDEGLLA